MTDPYAKLGRQLSQGTILHQMPRQQGKSSVLAAAYGAQQAIPKKINPDDPLEGLINYHLKGRDKRFGNIVTYKCNNSTLALFHKEGEIGTTGVRGDKAPNGVFAIAWVRRHGTERLKEAVACALLLHEHVVLLRAFDLEV